MNIALHGGDLDLARGRIDLSISLNPLGPPGEALTAVREQLFADAVRYPEPEAGSLLEALAAREGQKRENLIAGAGAAQLICLLAQAAGPKRALVFSPTFSEYERALSARGCEVLHCPLRKEEGFAPTRAFLGKLKEGIDMAFVCNPNNPTGLLMEPKLLEEIAAKCRKEGILLVVDECFLDLCSHPFAVSAKRELDHNPFLFILKAFTKTYALAGLRIGYGISANQALLKRMRSLAAPWALSGPAQRAALACLDQKDYLSKARRVIESERRALYGCLCRIGEKRGDVSALWGQANFLFFQGPERLDSALLDEGFVIRSCDNFRGLGPGFYRAALAPAPVNGAFISALMRILL